MVVSESSLTKQQLDLLSINTIRTLAIDGVQQANSGHPGAPMALAPVAYCLWQQFLRFDPADPVWPNRDRFVLSNGHASMLLYAMLFLAEVRGINPEYEKISEFAITLDDIKHFRQAGSRTPGHPEYRMTAGVETTTGPLGQGIGNSVGMAMASKWLGARYNRPGFEIFDYNIYAICGDGDLMEGVGSEAASLAGHLKLPNLCWIYDNNHVTLDGPASLSFSEDVSKRFEGYKWNVVHVTDANDLGQLSKAYETFLETKDRPTLIVVNSHIGYGSPNKQDKSAAHGEPLGPDEVKLAKKFYDWPEDAKFLVPDGVLDSFRQGIGKRGHELQASWKKLFADYSKQNPELAEQINRMQRRELPDGWDKNLPTFPADAKGVATRESSGKIISLLGESIPWLVGGSADLATSTKAVLKSENAGDFQANNYAGRNLHFGVREHAMGAAVNGLAVSKLRAYGGTFFNFSDYMRPSIRLAALMELPCIFIYTHDSIGLGEDGPTHQPVEQLASLRAVPGLIVMRPADANEVVEAWKVIVQLKHEPVALVLSRQNLPTFDRTKYGSASGVAKGAYILADAANGKPQVILMGTGSEVSLCIQAYEKLTAEGIGARVVSMPSWEIFEKQDASYRDKVFPPEIKARVSVEQAATFGWSQYVGSTGKTIGMHTFGSSAPLKDLLNKFGFEPDKVVEAAKETIAKSK
ncbi:MAG: transketolase [Acidobacteriaceae bacterium]